MVEALGETHPRPNLPPGAERRRRVSDKVGKSGIHPLRGYKDALAGGVS